MRWAGLLTAVLQTLGCCLLVAGHSFPGLPDHPMTEKELLLTFRDGITNWAEVQAAWALPGWCTGDDAGCLSSVCTWGGVECNPYHVHEGNFATTLRLACSGCTVPLRGQLRAGLHLLQHLEILDLQGNEMSGPLPPEWGEPNSFGELLELNINNNQFTGNMPESWAIGPAFLVLADLQMAGNRFNGTFPAGFAITNTSFVYVMSFSFANNQFSGQLPSYVNGMITMSVAEMHNNRFTGTLPAQWGTQGYWWNSTLNNTQALEYLTLHGNNLTGGLPDEWAAPGSFTALQQLTLSHNPELGGTLPAKWGNHADGLPLLYNLNVSGCGLTGPLPEWGSGLQNLRTLTLTDNALTGTIPSSWANLSSLEQVTIQPGNPDLCPARPAGATFKLCDGMDLLCDGRDSLVTDSALCADLISDANAASQPGGGGGSSFPVAAVVVPVAVVAAALLAVGGLRWRRRQVAAARGQRDAAAAKQPVYQDAETGLFYTATGMPLPPDSAAGQEEGAGFGAKHGGANATWLPCFFGRRSVEACPSSESSECVAPRAASPGGGPRSQHALRSPSSNLGPVPSSGGSCAAAAAGSSERTTSSCLAGGPGSVDNPCFSSRELAALQLSDWEIKHEEIQILKRPDGSDWRLGSGGFGTVFKAMRNGVQPVAVKILGTGNPDMVSMVKAMTESEFAREISILRACRDTNILQFQGACLQDTRTLLITEYMEGGNLTHNLRSQKVCWWRRGKKVALDVARALAYLHSRRIVHLDIKSANVLLTRDGTAKVGDVGMARIMAGDYVSGVVGTLAWSAPELLMGQRCTTKADIYSFGVVLWEICTGELPVRGQLRDPRVPEECSAEVVDVLYRCLRPEPGGRPTATELVELLLNAPSTPPASTQPSTLDVGTAGAAGGGALDISDGVLAQQAQQQAQQQQRAQRQGQQAQRSDGGGAASSGDLQMALSLGGNWLSGGTLASVQSQVELEEELVAELVAESAPNSSGVSVGRRAPLSGGRSGAGAAGGLQRRLVLPPPGSLMSASPFAALYEQSPGSQTPYGQSPTSQTPFRQLPQGNSPPTPLPAL